MTIPLDTDLRKLVQARLKAGKYASVADVVRAGLISLEDSEAQGEFDAGEMDQLLAAGERSIKALGTTPSKTVFAEIRKTSGARQARRLRRSKSA